MRNKALLCEAEEFDSGSRTMIEYGFQEFGINRIVNSVAVENARSVNLLRRLGFQIENNLKSRPFAKPFQNSPGISGILNNSP